MREHRGLAVAIAVVTVLFLASLPFLVPTTIWFAMTIYAIVKEAGSAPEQPDAAAILVTIVGIVTFFTLAIAAAISLLGRAVTPRRRRRGSRKLPAYDA